MTFVNQNQATDCALSTIRRINDTFDRQLKCFVQTTTGRVRSDLQLANCQEAKVRLTPYPTRIYARAVVSKSAGALMAGKSHPFKVTERANGDAAFSVNIRNQTDATRIEEEIKRLLILHLYRSRETRLTSPEGPC
jgi:hypothetical protein